ncbi:PREDICTED: uncharacterized protein LOC108567753 [Nicrophorus vespilloides]|uniref:Uncharacterized protein LOC108567753 n=1 Tax=Nicrophorus vespilloides TaxID=110193 RepID=A0ABM1NAN6_NICVS|nr:PREDICTED: uncharacterized protein LOC108567753 [Nicrophorus vespilloides]
MRDLFKTGKTNKALEETVGKMGLEHFMRFDYKDYFPERSLICEGCEAILDALIQERRNGTDRETFVEYLKDVCVQLNIQADYVCEGLLNSNVDIIMYIIDNKPDLDGHLACPMVLQSLGCREHDPVEWNIEIQGKNTVEKQKGSNEEFKILQISDIHFDPNYQEGSLANCNQPVCCEFDSGLVEKPEDAAGKWSEYNSCDTPLDLVHATFRHINKQHDDFDYVYFTGDIISHRVWATDVYNNTKDMITILDATYKAFGDIPVFPILGNHEPHPLNVWSSEGVTTEAISTQWVYNLIAEEWGKWLPEETKETILKGGYYTVLVKPGFRIIAINSNVCYTFNWWLLFDEVDPFGQLQWMEGVLNEAEKSGESVHILSHVPSGDSTCHIPWAREFRKIIRRYSNTISAIFNGHTHEDEMIIYYDEEEPTKAINVAFNGASITSYADRNPSYKVYSIDKSNFNVLDFDEWIFNVTEANLTPHQDPVWYKLYSFKQAYGVDNMEPQSLADLTVRMASDHNLLDEYFRFNVREADTAMAKGCDDNCKKFNLCEMVTGLYGDTTQCDALMSQWNSLKMLTKLFVYTLIIGFVVAENDSSAKLQRGIKELFETKRTSQELSEVVNRMGLKHFLKFDANKYIESSLLCEACEAILDALIDERRNGASKEALVGILYEFCKDNKIQADHICDSLLNMNADIVLYIIDNKPDLNGAFACPTLLQSYGCRGSDPVEWDVEISDGKTVSKIEGSNKSFKVLQFSDIHYDANYQVGSLANCPYPVCCEFDSGEPLKPEDVAAGKWGEYSCNTPMDTLEATFKHILKQHEQIDYIYFTGDIIGHRVWGTDPFNNTQDMIKILDTIHKHFGNIPVFPILGNHEPHPVNVWSADDAIQEEFSTQWVFNVSAKHWSKWLPKDTQETILRGGYYTVLVKPGFRIIAINSNVCYTFNWWLLFDEVDPYGQLQWMEGVLNEAEKKGEVVHVLSHVPSGDPTCHLPWAREFRRILRRYSNTVSVIFNGHTHEDEMVIYYDEKDSAKPINVAFNGASLTTYWNRNPSYKVYTIDEKSYDVLDYEEWACNITESNLKPDEDLTYNKLYSFKDAYGVSDMSLQSLSDLTVRMAKDHSLLDEYYRFSVREAGPAMADGCDDDCRKFNLCEMVTSLYGDTKQCDTLLAQWD